MTHVSPKTFFIATPWDNAVGDYLRALARELIGRGHQVHMLISEPEMPVLDGEHQPTLHLWPSVRPTTLADARFLHDLTRRLRPDCYMSTFGADNVMGIVGVLNRVPLRVSWHRTVSRAIEIDESTPGWRRWLLRQRKRVVKRLYTHILVNSRRAMRDAQQSFAVPAEKCHIFHNAMADPLRDAAPAPVEARANLVCVARLAPSKGQAVIIQALAALKPDMPDLHVTFLGEGAMLDTYRQLAEACGVAENCHFAGKVSHDEVMRQLATAAALVVATTDDAFGWVNIEAMSLGTPVIASDTGGYREIIREGIDGLFYPPGDSAALAGQIRLFMSDAECRFRMGCNARARFLEAFEHQVVIKQLAEWLESQVQSKAG